MTASSRGSRAAASIIRSSRRSQYHQSICADCLHFNRNGTSPLSSRRNYAIAATALKITTPEPNTSLPHLPKLPPLTTSSASEYKVAAGVLLSRAPIITAPQTAFEKAYFFYQKRLNERLVIPFTRYFYFKKDTPADTDWKIKAKERNWTPQRELGGYKAYGDEAWNDELLTSDTEAGAVKDVGVKVGKLGLAEPKWTTEALVRDSKVRAVEGKDGLAVEVKEGMEELLDAKEGGVERPMSRITEADRTKDVRRLDRQLARTLYLLVKKDNVWTFPSAELVGRENLHQAAERILVQAAGMNMNTWIIGHVPVGHYITKPKYSSTLSYIPNSATPSSSNTEAEKPSRAITRNPTPTSTLYSPGRKTFFMKGRILAGQADLKNNLLGLEDYRWATKEEVQKLVKTRYYSFVKDMLADR